MSGGTALTDGPVLPLDDFQRLMHMWSADNPFSGIDAIEYSGHVDVELLRCAAETELSLLGIGYPAVTADQCHVQYLSTTPALAIDVVGPEPSGAASALLARKCEAELNQPFAASDALIRLWVVMGEPASYIGMTWQHWPIDGVSAAELFRRILARFVGKPVPHPSPAVEMLHPDRASIFAPFFTFQRNVRDFFISIREFYYHSRIFVVPRPATKRTANEVHLLEVPQPARPHGATLNDVLAAALMWSLAKALPDRQQNDWRRWINLINFVDLRPFGGDLLQRAWGSYLGYCSFFMPDPRPKRFDELIADVQAQSVRIKEGELFFASLGGFALLRHAWQWLPNQLHGLPYFLCPFTAGLTNTRFRSEWNSASLDPRFGRSWRVAPCAPMAPLVLDVCTKGNDVSLALTCEAGSYMSDRIDVIKTAMMRVLD